MLNRLIPLGQLILLLGWGFSPLETLAQPTSSPAKIAYSKPFCLSRLSHQIDEIIEQPELKRSQWGILIQSLTTGETFYQLNEDKYFIPASNVKLLTSAAALLTLGKEFQIRTSFYATGSSPNLESLTVVGRGDPSLTTEQLKSIVQQLKQSGVRQIDQLIINANYFNTDGINPTWEWDDIHYYYAPTLTSLTLNDNQVTLSLKPQQVGQPLQLEWSDELAGQQWEIINQTVTGKSGKENTITLHPQRGTNLLEIRGTLAVDSEPDTFGLAILNPNQYFLSVLKDLLEQENIIVLRDAISKEIKIQGQEILSIESPKLSELLNKINQNSDNLYAENLRQIVLKESPQYSKILEELTQETKWIDGSGLSRRNLITPHSLVKLLTLISQDPNYQVYKDSLAVAGEIGTLKSRFLDTAILGKLWGKTGTLTGVSSLSGYLELENYSPIVFSIMVNYSDQPSSILRQNIDKMILSVSEFPECITENIPPKQNLENFN